MCDTPNCTNTTHSAVNCCSTKGYYYYAGELTEDLKEKLKEAGLVALDSIRALSSLTGRKYDYEIQLMKRKEYNSRPEVKEKRKAYFSRPDVKERRKEYSKQEEVKERKKRQNKQKAELVKKLRESHPEMYAALISQ